MTKKRVHINNQATGECVFCIEEEAGPKKKLEDIESRWSEYGRQGYEATWGKDVYAVVPQEEIDWFIFKIKQLEEENISLWGAVGELTRALSRLSGVIQDHE